MGGHGRGRLNHAGSVGQGVGVDVVDLHGGRELAGVGLPAPAADGHVEDHPHGVGPAGGRGTGHHRHPVEVEADRVLGPQHPVGVPAVGVELEGVVVEVAVGPGSADVVLSRLQADGLHHIALLPLAGIGPGRQPEGGPAAGGVGELGADLEVAVLLLEVAQRVQHARRPGVAEGGVCLSLRHGLGGDREHPVGDRERVQVQVVVAQALEAGVGIDLRLAVGGQGIGPLVLQIVGGEVGLPDPGLVRIVVEIEAVELIVEGHRPKLGGIERQQELLVGKPRRKAHPAEGQALAPAKVQQHVGALLGHGRPHVRRRLEGKAGQLQLVGALPVVDDIVPLAGMLDKGGGGVGRPHQHIVPRPAVQPGAAVGGDQVVQRIAHAVVEVAVDLQVLDIGRQGDRHIAGLGVDPAARLLQHPVLGAGDEEGGVARGADQGIAPALAVERARPRLGGQGLVPGGRPIGRVRGRCALGHDLSEIVVIGHEAAPPSACRDAQPASSAIGSSQRRRNFRSSGRRPGGARLLAKKRPTKLMGGGACWRRPI